MNIRRAVRRNTFMILLGVLSCAPQATVVRLQPEDLAQLKIAEPIYAVHTQKFPLYVANPGATMGALGFLIGGALGESQGSRIARENQLKDPVFILKEQFLTTLAQNYAVKNVKVIDEPRADDKIEGLKADLKQGTVFVFRSTVSGVSQPSGFSTKYDYDYRAEVRLLRLADSQVMWQSNCRAGRKTLEHLSTFTADGAKLLKAEMAAAANECARQLLDHFSGTAAR